MSLNDRTDPQVYADDSKEAVDTVKTLQDAESENEPILAQECIEMYEASGDQEPWCVSGDHLVRLNIKERP